MVSGFICSKNSNKNVNNNNQNHISTHQHQHQNQQPQPQTHSSHLQQQTQQQNASHHHQQQQPPAKSPKSHKKSEKCKRPLSKTDSKKSINELLTKPSTKEASVPATLQPPPPASAHAAANHNNGHYHNNKDAPSTSKASLKPPTKVKSGSWKRSEKQISSYNSISGKKSKSLRKRSPTWLKFPNSAVKMTEKASPTDSTSVCRPGTLYSDVLFGAGSSCLVKIKTLTPRRSQNTAQKKLTKALLKCAGNENEASGSEAETDRELFPSLNEYPKTPPPTTELNIKTTNANTPLPSTTVTTNNNCSNAVNASNAVAPRSDDEADVVILSETNGVQTTENGFSDISYGSYLEQHFKHMNGSNNHMPLLDNTLREEGAATELTPTIMPQLGQKCTSGKPFTIEIPQWNFLDADITSDAAYPKFLCQFEDEHYLKAEKMALLGLKLALGNNAQQAKFKF